uniref:LAGLIDADG endonuclease n=1 Tax=Bipolaris cookei TaxID=74410 RepID=A0A2H4NRT2_9PLEO|nr:LAGLIDADG endonuclease [Bipolaris cookei]ATV95695.1 LAGLIDADG endonuclease [Bipolaris cookei]
MWRNGFFGHPEVTYVGLLTSLYAGTPSLYSSKYSSLNGIVKKLEQWRKSAGNILYIKNGTSETLRDGVLVNLENVKRVSDHVPKHLKPLNNEQLGYYLAGLIDGDGHFSKAQQLVITFSSPDAFLAYYLKERLGYGNVRKVKDKNAYLLIISNKKGMLNVINLINGKLKTEHRFNQVVNNVLSHTKYADQNSNFTIDSSKNLDNHWLAGFSDADASGAGLQAGCASHQASFQIKIIKRITRNKPEIRLNFQIDQKNDLLLNMIKEYLGGNIGYRKSQDTYYYGSTNFGSAKRVIEYFDPYHLQSRKHISYLRWRKVYRLIQDKEHLTDKGLSKILKIKSLINRHEENTRT